jgi:hypothetical protein
VNIFSQGIDEHILRALNIRNHPGYLGAFTRDSVEGAIPNGTRIVKAKQEADDATPLGTEGVVLGSIFAANISESPMYFVEWANKPKFAVGVIGWKIAPKG